MTRTTAQGKAFTSPETAGWSWRARIPTQSIPGGGGAAQRSVGQRTQLPRSKTGTGMANSPPGAGYFYSLENQLLRLSAALWGENAGAVCLGGGRICSLR